MAHVTRDRFNRVLLATALVALVAAVACSETGPPAGDAGVSCPRGLQPGDAGCVPWLDTCADNEVPLLGGGCKRVGVEPCDGGLRGPPDWTCKPIGPPATCLAGWARTKDGWCEPVLPAASCPAGTMEVLGQSACQPVGACGSGTWGNITFGGSIYYVDQAYAGGGSNGSQAAPYTAINDALKQATSGGMIAVAAGTYKEDLAIKQPHTRLVGRCAKLVTIEAQGVNQYGVIEVLAGPATLRGFTVTGAKNKARCIDVYTAKATIEEVLLKGCSGEGGISVTDGAEITVKHSLIDGATRLGIGLVGATAIIEDSVIRGTQSDPTIGAGHGVQVSAHWLKDGAPSKATLKRCLVDGNIGRAVSVISSAGVIEGSVIRRTKPVKGWGHTGYGVFAAVERALPPTKRRRPTVTLRDCVVAENTDRGIDLFSATALIERTVVRDTQPDGKGGAGFGVQADPDPYQDQAKDLPTRLTLRDSVLARNRGFGLLARGSEVTIERSRIQDTLAQSVDKAGGFGLAAGVRHDDSLAPAVLKGRTDPSRLTVRDSVVAGNLTTGVFVVSSTAVLQRTVVKETKAQLSDGVGGHGVQARQGDESGLKRPSSVEIEDCLFEGNTSTSAHIASSSAVIKRTVIKKTLPCAAGRCGNGIYVFDYMKMASPPTLEVSQSVVTDSRAAGIHVYGARATVSGVAVRSTRGDSKGFGDGVTVEGKVSRLTIDASLVTGSARAGAMFHGAGGAVSRSIFSGGAVGIALERGARPTIAADVLMTGNKDDEVSVGQGREPTPRPEPPPSAKF